jgi:RNA polymerase sigma factor (sigma-70 family)
MTEGEWLARQFEDHRGHLRGVAYRMLGSLSEADDTLQDAWLRVSRAGSAEVENMRGWLTTVVARVALNKLRTRRRRREEPFEAYVPDPVVSPDGELQPEDEALLADSVGLALQVVLESLTPPERLAFVLHDMFDLPFDEIAPMVGRSSVAARQLASRARRRVRGAAAADVDRDVTAQREVVDAFFRAARGGDFEGLLAVLDPDVVLRADYGPGRPGSRIFRGPEAVTSQARPVPGSVITPVLVNGGPGVVITLAGRTLAVMGFTIADGRIVEIDAIADPDRVGDLAAGL